MRLQICDRDYYTVAALGKSREITPEGFLLCRGVAIARIGVQTYDSADLPIEAGSNGKIIAERLPEEVFRRETLASFEGKPVTVNHPDGEFVTPENWKRYSVGITQNVRRGDGSESDLMLADLLITSADAIAYVNREFPQISAGYDCDYDRVGPGKYVQRNIIGNHVALVRTGRAGLRCAIKDEDTTVSKKGTTSDKRTIWARIRTAMKANDSAAVEAELAEAERVEAVATTDAAVEQLVERVSTVETGLTSLQTGLADIKKLLTKDAEEEAAAAAAAAASAAKQPVYTADAVREIVARAEILAPGISIPTTDALAAGDAAQQLMAAALEKAHTTDAGAECIKPFLMGRELKELTGDALLGVFNGTAELMRTRNNQRIGRPAAATTDNKPPLSIDDINKANADFWANRK